MFTAVCVHLDGLNAEHKFRVWVTILGHMSRHFQFIFQFNLCKCFTLLIVMAAPKFIFPTKSKTSLLLNLTCFNWLGYHGSHSLTGALGIVTHTNVLLALCFYGTITAVTAAATAAEPQPAAVCAGPAGPPHRNTAAAHAVHHLADTTGPAE